MSSLSAFKGCATLLLLCALPQIARGEDRVTLRLAPTKNVRIIEAIANNAMATEYDLKAGDYLPDAIRAAIRERCGVGLRNYFDRLLRINPEYAKELRRKRLRRDIKIHVPACGYWEDDANTLMIRSPATVEDLADQFLGGRGEKSVRRVRRSNQLAPRFDPKKAIPRENKRVKWVIRSVSLTPKYSNEEFAKRLFASIGLSFPGFKKSCDVPWRERMHWYPIVSLCEARNISEYSDSRTANAPEKACKDDSIEKYGLPSAKDVVDAVEENKRALDNTSRRMDHIRQSVQVVDTGLKGYSSNEDFLRKGSLNKNVVSNSLLQWSGARKTTFGATMTFNRARVFDLAPSPSYQSENRRPEHGAHVLGILMGLGLPGGEIGVFKEYFAPIIANVIDPDFRPPNIDNRTLGDALQFNMGTRATIMNISIESDMALSTYTQRANRSLLIVAAAGNFGNGKSYTAFPASYGGENNEHIISVAARNSKGELPAFSNRGQGIDLSAPGCGIESLVDTFTGNRAKMDGTSQAAPYVTMTAALLSYLGIQEPREIKQRILASVKTRADTHDDLFSRGSLDVVNSLRFDKDILETKKYGKLLGEIRSTFDPCYDDLAGWRTWLKIVPGYAPNVSLVDYETTSDQLRIRKCRAKPFELDFVDQSGKSWKFNSSEIDDIIYRHRLEK